MSVLSLISHRRALTAGLPALLAALTLPGLLVPRPAAAHEASCPLCKLPVTQDTAAQDNEVALRYGRKRIEYKCVSCAITDANRGAYQSGDVTILAPSETKGRPIPVTRTGGKWSAPTGTVFVGVKASHRICQETYRAFTSRAAFDAYVKKNQARLKDARPLTLDQMIAAAK